MTDNLAEWLLAQIAADEEVARAATRGRWKLWGMSVMVRGLPSMSMDPARVLAECAAKRAVVELQKSWPVLVEQAPELEHTDTFDAMTMRLTQRIAWVTQQEYRKRFGDEPPTTPALRILAQPYRDREGYRTEWDVS